MEMATEGQSGLTRTLIEDERLAKCGSCGIEGVFNKIAEHAQTCVANVVTVNPAEDGQTPIVQLHHVVPDDEKKMFIWNKPATKMLIDLYAERKVAFNDRQCKKRRLWTEIADELGRQGHDVTWLQVENKWKSLKSCYQRNKDVLKQDDYSRRRQISSRLSYLKTLDAILHQDGNEEEGNGIANSSSASGGATQLGSPTVNIRPSTSQDSGEIPQSYVTIVSRSTPPLQSSSVSHGSDLGSTEPGWFRLYREDCERRHLERMALQRDWMRQQRQVMHDLIDAFLTCKKCRHR